MSGDGFLDMPIESFAQGRAQLLQQQAAGAGDRELAALYLSAFSTPAGQKVLQHLRQVFVDPPYFEVALGLDNGAAYGFTRQGQRDVVRHVEGMMQRAQEPGKDENDGNEKD